MLHTFISAHREEIMRRSGAKPVSRSIPQPIFGDVAPGVCATLGRVLIEVEDQCGGLPDGNAERTR
jgi:hypothetical protein